MKEKVFSYEGEGTQRFIEGAKRGHVSIEFKVFGFWSSPITVRAFREYEREAKGEYRWATSVSTSSGGREDKEVRCDIEAYGNFAAALLEGLEVAKSLEGKSDMLEALYQQGRLEYKQAEENERRRREEALAKDPAIGQEVAQALIEKAAELGRAVIKAHCRASTGYYSFSVTQEGKVVKLDEKRISRKAAIDKLAGLSTRAELSVIKGATIEKVDFPSLLGA